MARIGIVLGAGGATGGGFHAGVLAGLAEATGWEPRDAELIVGSSAGSLTGAILRRGLSAADLVSRMQKAPLSDEGTALLGPAAMVHPDLLRSPPRLQLPGFGSLRGVARGIRRPWATRPMTFLAALLPSGFVSSEAITTMVHELAGSTWPDRELWLTAVRIRDGRRVVFGREGSPQATLGEAAAASCAIPGLFAPVQIGGIRYVDGGMWSPTNADLLTGRSLDLAIVCAPMAVEGRPARTFDMPARLAFQAMLAREVAHVRRGGTEVVTFAPTAPDLAVMGSNPMSPGRRGAVAVHMRDAVLGRLEQKPLMARLGALRAK